MEHSLNADFTRRVHLRTADMAWQPSPAAGVERKRLELSGPLESGRVTSVVRYAPGSRFASHGHPEGEEILVLEGVFEDEHGRYPAGTFLLNPEGFVHAPGSSGGCTLFVKLRQYPGVGRRHVCLDTRSQRWSRGDQPGVEQMTLYAEAGVPERIDLVRLAAGADWRVPVPEAGAEAFLLEGELEADGESCTVGDWLRLPGGARTRWHSAPGCLLYLKRGHLPGAASPTAGVEART